MWFWGSIAKFALRKHIANELRPLQWSKLRAGREDVLEIMHDRLNLLFDEAWPKNNISDE
jgi:hypothetical protein